MSGKPLIGIYELLFPSKTSKTLDNKEVGAFKEIQRVNLTYTLNMLQNILWLDHLIPKLRGEFYWLERLAGYVGSVRDNDVKIWQIMCYRRKMAKESCWQYTIFSKIIFIPL